MSRSVLLVDDEVNVLKSLVRLFRNEGYWVFTALNAEEGLAVMEENDISLVISDNNMPGMSGVDFLVKVREVSPVAVRILLTGYADFDTAVAAVDRWDGFTVMTKPWDDDELLTMVRRALA